VENERILVLKIKLNFGEKKKMEWARPIRFFIDKAGLRQSKSG
jgi:hypothetical protein